MVINGFDHRGGALPSGNQVPEQRRAGKSGGAKWKKMKDL
jgi:hypothetical protein